MTQTPVLQILFICTGNICRSPLAEQLLNAELEQRGASGKMSGLRIASRGTHARVGEGMEEQSARQSRTLGGDPDGHIAAQLTTADLDAADLVVTMTLEQRAFAARLRPSASKKSVTLLEFARLIDHGWNEAADGRPAAERERLALLLGKRSMVPPPRRDDDLVIPDPFGRSSGTHSRVARQIHASIQSVAAWLAAGSADVTLPAEAPPGLLTRRQLRELREGVPTEGEKPPGFEPGLHAQ